LDQGFATLNLSSTFNQNNVSQVLRQWTLVVTVGKNILNGNNLLDKRYIAHLSDLKMTEFQT
jgi:iron complex outermembrane receptor protein